MTSDYLLDAGFDVMCQDGDIPAGDATYQHQAVLVKVLPGSFKQAPTTGVGVDNFLLDESPGLLLREIRSQFAKDGMRVRRVDISTDGKLTINANY